MVTEPYADNFISVDYAEHTEEKPFCWDQSCECHENEVDIFQIWLYIQDGLMTPAEATNFVRGKGI